MTVCRMRLPWFHIFVSAAVSCVCVLDAFGALHDTTTLQPAANFTLIPLGNLSAAQREAIVTIELATSSELNIDEVLNIYAKLRSLIASRLNNNSRESDLQPPDVVTTAASDVIKPQEDDDVIVPAEPLSRFVIGHSLSAFEFERRVRLARATEDNGYKYAENSVHFVDLQPAVKQSVLRASTYVDTEDAVLPTQVLLRIIRDISDAGSIKDETSLAVVGIYEGLPDDTVANPYYILLVIAVVLLLLALAVAIIVYLCFTRRHQVTNAVIKPGVAANKYDAPLVSENHFEPIRNDIPLTTQGAPPPTKTSVPKVGSSNPHAVPPNREDGWVVPLDEIQYVPLR